MAIRLATLQPYRPSFASGGAETKVTRLVPFGLRLDGRGPLWPPSVPHTRVEWLRSRVQSHRLVVLRGFEPLHSGRLAALGRALGSVEVAADEWGTECLGAPGEEAGQEILMHWARRGARCPRYLILHCWSAPAPGAGGESLFCDTTRLLSIAPEPERAAWQRRAAILAHPESGEAVLRYLELPDVPLCTSARLDHRLYDPLVCYAHSWRSGDLLLADNHALLHGRAPFASARAAP